MPLTLGVMNKVTNTRERLRTTVYGLPLRQSFARADAAGTTTPGSPPGGSASQLKGRHVPHQLRASGSVCRRGCHQIPPWADMFGGWDVMIPRQNR